jgi:hypothetical protein
LFLDEYAAQRDMRFVLWRALLRGATMVIAQLHAEALVERLILLYALPSVQEFKTRTRRLADSFTPYRGSMALRMESFEMLSFLVQHRGTCQPLYYEMLQALRRHNVVVHETMRLRPPESTPAEDRVNARRQASAILLLMILDRAADVQLWQLLQESACVAAVHAVYLETRNMAPVTIEHLKVALPFMDRPASKAAAGFLWAILEFERTSEKQHPLLVETVRVSVKPGASRYR